MIIFINNNSTKFCQITLRIKRFVHKRKVVPFFFLTVYIKETVAEHIARSKRTGYCRNEPIALTRTKRRKYEGRDGMAEKYLLGVNRNTDHVRYSRLTAI